MSQLPLEGIRVLDLATVLAAPVAATFLADFGAEVVKVEEPEVGDFTRARASEPGGRSLQWVQEGRNKSSVTLNLRTPEGQQMLRELVPHFDVVVTNYRPPTLEKWGIGPETLEALNPQAVILVLTGYGMVGPYRSRGAFDRIASSFAGLTHVSGEADREPVRSGFSVLDFMSAYMAAFAVVTALYHRDLRGGTGQVIDQALYEAGARATEDAVIEYSSNGRVRGRAGNRNSYIVPASDFTTKDGRRVSIHAATDTLFKKLAVAIGRPELAESPKFSSRKGREQNQEELYPIIDEWAAERGAQEIVESLTLVDVPASLVMNVADMCADPHYRERGTLMDVEDAEHGALTMVSPLPKMSKTPGTVRSLGPLLGEHNHEIYGRLLGIGPQQLETLREQGVI